MSETLDATDLKLIALHSKASHEWNPPWYEPELDYTVKAAMNENPPWYEPEVEYTVKVAMNENPPW